MGGRETKLPYVLACRGRRPQRVMPHTIRVSLLNRYATLERQRPWCLGGRVAYHIFMARGAPPRMRVSYVKPLYKSSNQPVFPLACAGTEDGSPSCSSQRLWSRALLLSTHPFVYAAAPHFGTATGSAWVAACPQR